MTSVLTVISGLPATGKSTVASAVAQHTATPYLRVDRIEQAIVAWSSLVHPVGPVGYAVAHQIAAEQLELGLDVIVECVNPVAVTRDGWVGTATAAGAMVVEVELICSDPALHRRRVETRPSDVEGLVKPTWQEVESREYETWSRPHLVLDTATMGVEPIVDRIVASIESARTMTPSSSSYPGDS
jgi:predicted kinase